MLCWQCLRGPYQGDCPFSTRYLKSKLSNLTELYSCSSITSRTPQLCRSCCWEHTVGPQAAGFTHSFVVQPQLEQLPQMMSYQSGLRWGTSLQYTKLLMCWKAERKTPEAAVSSLCPHLFLDIWVNVFKLCCHPSLCTIYRQWNTEVKLIKGKMGLMRSLSKHSVMSRQPKLKYYINSITKFYNNFGGRPVSSVGKNMVLIK